MAVKRWLLVVINNHCALWYQQKLHTVHSGFHADLVRACVVPRDGAAATSHVTIADCFITWKERLLVYGEFCSNLPRAQELLDQLCDAKPLVNQRVTVLACLSVCLSVHFILWCCLPSVLWRCWLGGRKGIRPVKNYECCGAGVVICLERGADLHTAQLMPLPLTVSCFSKIQFGR